MTETRAILDGNEAAALVAYRLSETIAIYPITPSTPMAESCDEWSAQRRPNLFGSTPSVVEMQSEGGAAGAIHGMLMGGALTTTFTASQGLLLMIPNMYKIAGELLPFVMHVTARSLATHALSIFGDHSDVMACRQTGFAMLASNSVQEAHDMAAIAHLASLESRVPFMHFFDGFRTSHEINHFTPITDDQLREMVDLEAIDAFRRRALTPDNPSVRGTAQNPDVFFQCREAANSFYLAVPGIVRNAMQRFAKVTGREYDLYEYVGDPQAETVVVVMGSASETLEGVVDHLRAQGQKVGVLKIRLFRPLVGEDIVAALPKTVRNIAVLDRTKEPGALGEPLYLDVVGAFAEAQMLGNRTGLPRIIGGRYGLGSKEFTPAMALAVFEEAARPHPKVRFTAGIRDDVTGLSLDHDPEFALEPEGATQAVFYGLGSDGTVGANKNSVKIIGDETSNFAQAYFVYDSKKSGGVTTSHLRFGPRPIKAPYLIRKAQFVGVHQFSFFERLDVLELAAKGATLLINSPYSAETVWSRLPATVQRQIIDLQLDVYVIDAYKVAREARLGARINTIMQVCFFALAKVMPKEVAIENIKDAIRKTYGKKGADIVDRNCRAVDDSLANLHRATVPAEVDATFDRMPLVGDDAPDFVQRVTAIMLADKGDMLPVSAFPVDGVWMTGTTKYEKRNIAQEIPEWDSGLCIQCNKCVSICPHAAIRAKFYHQDCLEDAPESFKSTGFRSRQVPDHAFSIQVAPEDCTGCNLCVAICPAKSKTDPNHKALNMVEQLPIRAQEARNFEFFLELPEPDASLLGNTIKDVNFRTPLFEFSGACAGCGETPYIKTLTQLYGDRLIIANATGCSSIFGGNLPTTPYTTNAEGRGPAWANSLFEDNAEFGLGLRLGVDSHQRRAQELLRQVSPQLYQGMAEELLNADQSSELGIVGQRKRVAALREWLRQMNTPQARELDTLADYLVDKSVWIVGGDGWAYDIGFGGLDHVLASGANVNVLVLDTGTYSNTGGQSSKATPMGAIAKFAAAGKATNKKDLGLQAMMYGHVYVAQIALGANDSQTINALTEAAAYNGPSLVIAYAHCISQGFNLCDGPVHQQQAVKTAAFPLYRYRPDANEGKGELKLDSKAPTVPLRDFMFSENRFKMLRAKNADRANELADISERHLHQRFALLQNLADSNK
ncbi:MAG: pyruvate:ferredoxin (flavodoxin) oxidoreductase [Verrucomicrobiota bacterium JB022]|nr:pyruvate:ferredoxin (flavodoxin) oxidoreductase [Verrucomicrobiota bacterium JB022]